MKRRKRSVFVRWGAVIAVSLVLGLVSAVAVAANAARAYMRLKLTQAAVRVEADWSVRRFDGGFVGYGSNGSAMDCWIFEADTSLYPEYSSLDGDGWSQSIRLIWDKLETRNSTGMAYRNGPTIVSTLHRYGWPSRCFYTVTVHKWAGTSRTSEMVTAIDELPFAPGEVIWGPLLANTAAFAGMWTPVCALPLLWFPIRSRVRIRHGNCPDCNYDRKGLAAGAVCPECGKRPEGV